MALPLGDNNGLYLLNFRQDRLEVAGVCISCMTLALSIHHSQLELLNIPFEVKRKCGFDLLPGGAFLDRCYDDCQDSKKVITKLIA